MGTDIHLWVEKKNADNTWSFAQLEPWDCDWCGGTGAGNEWREGATPAPCYWCAGQKKVNRYSSRNYDLFAMLAGVRNGRGFAGIKTGDGFIPISEPRGWPADLSPELNAIINYGERKTELYNSESEEAEKELGRLEAEEEERDKARIPGLDTASPGDHTASWVLLSELLAYFEKHESSRSGHCGFIPLSECPGFLELGRPANGYCGDIAGPRITKVSLEVAKKLLANPSDQDPERSYYVFVEWSEGYKDCVSKVFLDCFVPACIKLGKPEDVRLVFNFDS
jgi:hypothetical protein